MAMTQAQKSLVTMSVLLVAAGGMGAFAYWGVYKGEEAEEKKNDEQAKIFEFDKTKVKSMALLTKGGPVSIEKTENNWRLTAPIQARSDKGAIDAIVDKLSELKAKNLNEGSKDKLQPEYVVATAPDEATLKKFGLDKPELSASLVLDDGKKVEVEIGAENPYDKSVYFRRAKDNRVYLGDSGIKYPLDKTIFDLRDKSIVVQDNKDVQSIAVAGNGHAWAAERDGDGWKLTAPLLDRGDKETIESILTRIQTTRAKSFIVESLANGTEAAKYGLDKPLIEIVFTIGADKARKTLDIGEVVKGTDRRQYAHLKEGGPVAEIDDSLSHEILKDPGQLRERTIHPFDRTKVAKIEIEAADGGKFTVLHSKEKAAGATYESDKFTVEGHSDNLKTWKMSSALFTLASLKGATIVDDAVSDLSRYGLDKPQWSYRVVGDDGKELAHLLIGAMAGTRYFVTEAGTSKVFDVEKTTINELPKTIDELLDKPAAADAKKPDDTTTVSTEKK